MGHRHKKRTEQEPVDWFESDQPTGAAAPRPLALVGAGSFVSDLIDLARQHPEFEVAGLIDPAPSLWKQTIKGLPVWGWLDDLPARIACAVIGNPATPQGFDREAVFHILVRRGIHLPILSSSSSRCAPDVTLCRGTVLLGNCIIGPGARLGENCLIGGGAVVEACAGVSDHGWVLPGVRVPFEDPAASEPARPKSLAATLAREIDPISDIIRRINWANMEIVLVVDDQGALIGSITDGDIRRGLLAGIDTAKPVSLIMNRAPTRVPIGTAHGDMLAIMRQKSIRHLPVVDNDNRPVRLERLESVIDQLTGRDAIVMAGGLGSRLRPLTDNLPKPLLPVAGKPILDHILTGLKNSGIDDVVISVNYLGDRIRERVGDGRAFDMNVNYVTEKERLGTAGALSLLRPRPHRPFLVMNGDLLTRLNFNRLLEFQREHNHAVVMGVRKHETQVPYGVVDIRDGQVVGLREKPVYEHFINAGLYVLHPDCLDWIPRNRFFDMTDLIQVVLEKGGSVGAFPIIEYWRDIGRPEDLRAAGRESRELDIEPGETEPGAASVPMEVLV